MSKQFRVLLVILTLILLILAGLQPKVAHADDVSFSYNRDAAVNWALTYAPLNSSNRGDVEMCTWFASLVLWNGGFPTDDQWNWHDSHGWRHRVQGTETAWVANELVQYLQLNPHFGSQVEVTPLSLDNGGYVNVPIEPGDLIAYDLGYNPINDAADPTGGHSFTVDHIAVVVDVLQDPVNGAYPEVSEWGHPVDYINYVNGQNVDTGQPADYAKRGWTWSEVSQTWLQVEDNGPEYGGRDPSHAGINIQAELIHFDF